MQGRVAGEGSAGECRGLQGRVLLAFDFDHTVVDGNTDTAIVQPPGSLPDEVTSKYEAGGCAAGSPRSRPAPGPPARPA
jgi:hypothetical protein